MSKKCLYISLITISVLFLILSVGALIIFSNIEYFIDEQIKKQAPLVNGSKPLSKWSHPADDTEFKYTLYLFNVTNPDDVLKGNQRPIVQEVGPYDFIQKKTFKLERWHGMDEDDDELLDFRMKRTFYRDSTCRGNLNDELTILNVPLVSFANLAKIKIDKLPWFVKLGANVIIKRKLKKTPLFITQKAGDILFKGYIDNFTKEIAKLEGYLKSLGIKLDGPSAISRDGTFSLLGLKNNSDYGLWTINTGIRDLTQLGRLVRLDKTKFNVSCWSSHCSTFKGTDGLIHHPFIKDDDILPVFEAELNRTVYLEYERDTLYYGIPTKRFVLSNSTYASPKRNPYNKCFNPNQNDALNEYDGTLRVGHCNFLVPMVFSNPHFYAADSYFGERIHGFNPIKEKHESFADISKELGLVINGRKTVQLNIDTGAYSSFRNDMTREIFPVFWLSDSGSAGPSSIGELKAELYDKVENIKMYLIIFTAIFIAGSIVPIVYLVIDITLSWNAEQEDTQQIINSDSFSNLNNNDLQTKDENEENLRPAAES